MSYVLIIPIIVLKTIGGALLFKMAADVEMLDNKAEIKRQLGRRVRYGQVIEVSTSFA